MKFSNSVAPVAFFVFNRPDCSARVLEQIRKIRPGKLLVVADGPRASRKGEHAQCEEVRRIVEEGIDWPCEILKHYSSSNMGCRDRVVSGMDWVFTLVDQAIILEDDCLPDPSWFEFASVLLENYRHDERIFAISGTNFQTSKTGYASSYYLSHFPHIWGWATWRRVWRLYDVSLSEWPETRSVISGNLANPDAVAFFSKRFDDCKLKKIDTWDYQFCYLVFRHAALVIIPDRNLVKNIGFDERATHTTDYTNSQAAMETFAMPFPLAHPGVIEVNEEADRWTVRSFYTLLRPPFWKAILLGIRNIFIQQRGH